MKTQTSAQLSEHEQRLVQIVRTLPAQRTAQLMSFAESLLSHRRKLSDQDGSEPIESESEIAAEEARWGALMATAESQRLLEKMADEALAEIQEGHATPIAFAETGKIVPG